MYDQKNKAISLYDYYDNKKPADKTKTKDGTKESGLSFDEEYGHLFTKQSKAVATKAPEEKQGFVGQIIDDVKYGFVDAAGMAAKGVRALPGGPEIGGTDADKGMLDRTIDYLDDTPEVPLNEDGTQSAIHGGVRSATTSLVAGGVGALAAVAALGSAPVATAIAGATSLGLMFGGGTADESYKRGIENGLSEDEALNYALVDGSLEAGIEILTTAPEMLLGAGVSKIVSTPAKAALKNGAKELFRMKIGTLVGTMAATSVIETGSELGTAALQNENAKRFNLSDETALESMRGVAGPAFVASLIFGPLSAYGGMQYKKQSAKALIDPKADKKVRLKAAEDVTKELKKADKRAAHMWDLYSKEAIEAGQPLNLNMNYSDLTIKINNLEETAKYSTNAQKTFDLFKKQQEIIDERAEAENKTVEEVQEDIENGVPPVEAEQEATTVETTPYAEVSDRDLDLLETELQRDIEDSQVALEDPQLTDGDRTAISDNLTNAYLEIDTINQEKNRRATDANQEAETSEQAEAAKPEETRTEAGTEERDRTEEQDGQLPKEEQGLDDQISTLQEQIYDENQLASYDAEDKVLIDELSAKLKDLQAQKEELNKEPIDAGTPLDFDPETGENIEPTKNIENDEVPYEEGGELAGTPEEDRNNKREMYPNSLRVQALEDISKTLNEDQSNVGKQIRDPDGTVTGREQSINSPAIQEALTMVSGKASLLSAIAKYKRIQMGDPKASLTPGQKAAIEFLIDHQEVDNILKENGLLSEGETKQGMTPELVETEIRTEIGDQYERLAKTGVLNIVTSKEEIPDLKNAEEIKSEDGKSVAGYFKDGKIYLVANSIGQGNAYNIFMHEGVHRVLNNNGAYQTRSKKLFSEFKNLKKTKRIETAYKMVPDDTPKDRVDEEAFAYFMQDDRNRQHGIFRKSISLIKQFLKKFKIPFTKLNEADIAYISARTISKSLKSKSNTKTAGLKSETLGSVMNNKATKLAMTQKHIQEVKDGEKTATTRSWKLDKGTHELPDGTQINIISSSDAIKFSEIDNPDEYAKSEGYKSIEDMKKNSGFKNVVNWINGQGTMFVHQLEPIVDKQNTDKNKALKEEGDVIIKPGSIVKSSFENADGVEISYKIVIDSVEEEGGAYDHKKLTVHSFKNKEKVSVFRINKEGKVLGRYNEKDEFKVYNDSFKAPKIHFKKVKTAKELAAEKITTDAAKKANETIKRDYPPANTTKKLNIDNMVKRATEAEQIIAYGTLNDKHTHVVGDLAWYVQVGIDQNKPVFIYDTKQEMWFQYDARTELDADFVEAPKPKEYMENELFTNGDKSDEVSIRKLLNEEKGKDYDIKQKESDDKKKDLEANEENTYSQVLEAFKARTGLLKGRSFDKPAEIEMEDNEGTDEVKVKTNKPQDLGRSPDDIFGSTRISDNTDVETERKLFELKETLKSGKNSLRTLNSSAMRSLSKEEQKAWESALAKIDEDGNQTEAYTAEENSVIIKMTDAKQDLQLRNEEILAALFKKITLSGNDIFLKKFKGSREPAATYREWFSSLDQNNARDFVVWTVYKNRRKFDLSIINEIFIKDFDFTNLTEIPDAFYDLLDYADSLTNAETKLVRELPEETFEYNRFKTIRSILSSRAGLVFKQLRNRIEKQEYYGLLESFVNNPVRTSSWFGTKVIPQLQKIKEVGATYDVEIMENDLVNLVNRTFKTNLGMSSIQDITTAVENGFLTEGTDIFISDETYLATPVQEITEAQLELELRPLNKTRLIPINSKSITKKIAVATARANVTPIMNAIYSAGFSGTAKIRTAKDLLKIINKNSSESRLMNRHFKDMKDTDKRIVLKEFLDATNTIENSWYKEIFGYEDSIYTQEQLRIPGIDGIQYNDGSDVRGTTSGKEELVTKIDTINYTKEDGSVINYDHRDKMIEILSIARRYGVLEELSKSHEAKFNENGEHLKNKSKLANESEFAKYIFSLMTSLKNEKLFETDIRTAIDNELKSIIKLSKIKIIQKNLDNVFITDKQFGVLSEKTGVPASAFKMLYNSTGYDQKNLINNIDKLIDLHRMKKVKTALKDRFSSETLTERNMSMHIDSYIVDTIINKYAGDNPQGVIKAFLSKESIRLKDPNDRFYSRMAKELRSELLVKEISKANIEKINLENHMAIFTEDIFKVVKIKKGASQFEKNLENKGSIIGKFLNEDKQKFYDSFANLLGADLVLVSDNGTQSGLVYIAEEKPKLVINVRKELNKTGDTNVLHNIITHHIVNRIETGTNPKLLQIAKAKVKELSITRKGKSRFESIVTMRIGTNTDLERPGVEDQVVLEMLADSLTSREFYKSLASTFDGKRAAVNIIDELSAFIDSSQDLLHGKYDAYDVEYDSIRVFNESSSKEIMNLFAEMIGGIEFVQIGKNMTTDSKIATFQVKGDKNPGTILYSMGGFYSIAELEAVLETGKKVKGAVKNEWDDTFKGNESTKLKVMNRIEKWIKASLEWVKEHKPKGFIDDLLADQESMALASIVNHGMTQRTMEVKYQVTKKLEHIYNDFTEEDLEKLHDRITKGIIYDDKGGYKVGKPLDFKIEEDVKTALDDGISQEVIDAFKEYGRVADEQFERIRKVYPELDYIKGHYGQTIRWRASKNGVYLNDDYDYIMKPVDALEGTKEWQKTRNQEMSTGKIIEAGRRYRTINPNEMLLEYIAETEKLIKTREMMDEAVLAGKAKIFFDPSQAKREGWHEVDDRNGAFQAIVPNQSDKYRLIINGNPQIEGGKEIIFTTKKDAKVAADTFDGVVEIVPANSVDQTLVGYSLYQVEKNIITELDTFKSEEAANKALQKMKDKGLEGNVSPRFEQTRQAQSSQMYFEKDLARMLRTVVSYDHVKNASLFGMSGHKLLLFKNFMTSIEFAFSLFHAFTIGQELVASEMSIGSRNKTSFMAKLVPTNPVKALGRGLKSARELHTLVEAVMSDPTLSSNKAVMAKAGEIIGTENPDVLKMINKYFLVGGMMEQDSDLRASPHYYGKARYRSNESEFLLDGDSVTIARDGGDGVLKAIPDIAKNMVTSVQDVHNKMMKENPDSRITNTFKTMKFAATEQSTAWLMEYGIPRVKMAMWMKEYAQNLEKNKSKLASGELTETAIAHDTMKFIEDRFGEVNWKSQWMNKSYKSALIGLFRSFTWVTGSWKALTKAGVDFGKLGWFTVKGEQYELTSKGWWGVNAIISHMLTAGMVTVAYKAVASMNGDEVPDDEETDLITKLLFPRIDESDPYQRVTIPSYVTELYKIMHHLGIMGDHAEPSKLLSGRLNSLILNTFEVVKGEDWRGVTVRDGHDNVFEQSFDAITHIMAIAPISFSSALDNYNRRGFDPLTVVTSLAGLTKAPAVSLRSDATNMAYIIRRKEYKGKETKEEDVLISESILRATHKYGKGKPEALNKMLTSGRISQSKYNNAIKRLPYINGKKNPLYVDPLSSALKGLTIYGAIKTWHYMSDGEQKRHRYSILKKYNNVMNRKDRSYLDKQKIFNEMKVSGIL